MSRISTHLELINGNPHNITIWKDPFHGKSVFEIRDFKGDVKGYCFYFIKGNYKQSVEYPVVIENKEFLKLFTSSYDKFIENLKSVKEI